MSSGHFVIAVKIGTIFYVKACHLKEVEIVNSSEAYCCNSRSVDSYAGQKLDEYKLYII